MTFELPPLPYDRDALEPHVSRQTLDFHYGKHHQGYLRKLNRLIENDSALAGLSLEDIVRNSAGDLFNNAAQVWNHSFYWQSMSPAGGGVPQGELAQRIVRDFGSFEAMQKRFTAAALGQFGSGWTWLVQKRDGSLDVTATSNAETPLTDAVTPLLTCDVWEHAYYLDRQNDRGAYIQAWWQLVNWEFATANASRSSHRDAAPA